MVFVEKKNSRDIFSFGDSRKMHPDGSIFDYPKEIERSNFTGVKCASVISVGKVSRSFERRVHAYFTEEGHQCRKCS